MALNAGADFLAFLRALGVLNATGRAVDETYLNITLNTTTCYGGGTACPHDSDSYQAWLDECVEGR